VNAGPLQGSLQMSVARPRILIVEDEPGIADTLQYALRTEGYEPAWVATGEAGLADAR
jgi:two-component system catabolic regulation response regulator CreB